MQPDELSGNKRSRIYSFMSKCVMRLLKTSSDDERQ